MHDFVPSLTFVQSSKKKRKIGEKTPIDNPDDSTKYTSNINSSSFCDIFGSKYNQNVQ